MYVNTEKAIKIIGGNSDLYLKLITIFIDESDNRTTLINRAAKENDAKQLYEVVHALKNSALFIGADELAIELESIENAANKGDIADSQKIQHIKRSVLKVKKVLHDYRKNESE